MPGKTLLFCTSYFTSQPEWEARYERWLRHHLSIAWPIHSVVVIDDGSPWRPESRLINRIDAAKIGTVPLPCRSLVAFQDNLGRRDTLNYPGWWRSFQFAMTIADAYGFDKIVHVESDSYLLSNRMLDFVDQTARGWTLLWSDHFQMPESAIQIICADAFASYRVLAQRGPFGFPDQPAENLLPSTHVEKGFIGDRYSDFGSPLPIDADYAVQVTPGLPTSVPKSFKRRLRYAPLLKSRVSSEPVHEHPSTADDPSSPSQEPAITLRRGLDAYQRGDFAVAIAELEAAARALPDDPNALKFLSASLMRSGKGVAAIEVGERAVRIAPTDAGLANMLGSFYAAENQTEKAVAQWTRALDLDPCDLTPLRNIEVTQSNQDGRDSTITSLRTAVCDRLLERLVSEPFHRPAFNALLQTWDSSTADPQKVAVVIDRAVSEIKVFAEQEARGLAKAAFDIGQFSQAGMFISPLVQAPQPNPMDLGLHAQIAAKQPPASS